MVKRSAFPGGLAQPDVPATPAGADELESWREQQAISLAVTWAVPIASFFITLLLARLSLRTATLVSGACAALSGFAAPGLTLVFLLRRERARRDAARLPRLPRAAVHTARVE
ncbi:MAG: hypothetical protein R3B48_11975 [Kofleriaceae bacterium]